MYCHTHLECLERHFQYCARSLYREGWCNFDVSSGLWSIGVWMFFGYAVALREYSLVAIAELVAAELVQMGDILPLCGLWAGKATLAWPWPWLLVHRSNSVSCVFLFWWPTVLHEKQLTHTDLKPENILFVNSDYDISYNAKKASATAFAVSQHWPEFPRRGQIPSLEVAVRPVKKKI